MLVLLLISRVVSEYMKVISKRTKIDVGRQSISMVRVKTITIFFSNTISLSRHEQVSLSGLRFERYFSHHPANDGRGIPQNVAHLNMLVHDVINLFNYEH